MATHNNNWSQTLATLQYQTFGLKFYSSSSQSQYTWNITPHNTCFTSSPNLAAILITHLTNYTHTITPNDTHSLLITQTLTHPTKHSHTYCYSLNIKHPNTHEPTYTPTKSLTTYLNLLPRLESVFFFICALCVLISQYLCVRKNLFETNCFTIQSWKLLKHIFFYRYSMFML